MLTELAGEERVDLSFRLELLVLHQHDQTSLPRSLALTGLSTRISGTKHVTRQPRERPVAYLDSSLKYITSGSMYSLIVRQAESISSSIRDRLVCGSQGETILVEAHPSGRPTASTSLPNNNSR
eukprot:749698-Hanusia_phi.AAC.2